MNMTINSPSDFDDLDKKHKLRIFKKQDKESDYWMTVDETRTGYIKAINNGIADLAHTVDAALISNNYDVPTQAVNVSIKSQPKIENKKEYFSIYAAKEDRMCYVLNIENGSVAVGESFSSAVRNVITL